MNQMETYKEKITKLKNQYYEQKNAWETVIRSRLTRF